MLKQWLSVAFLIVSGAQDVNAHTVDLGKEIARGACSHIQTVDKQAFLVFNSQTSRIRYFDGKTPLSAVIFPSEPLPDNRPDDLMSRCARSAAEQAEQTKSSNPDAVPEDRFRSLLNKCLADNKARYQASSVILRRGPVECEVSPTELHWHEALKAGLAWCRGKDNFVSRGLCESREKNRFCEPENRWGTVKECEK